MTINHLNLPVTDVTKAVHFFESYFDFSCQTLKGDAVVAVLTNPDQFVLVLMRDKSREPTYPKSFHVGFLLNSPQAVEEQHKKLTLGSISLAQSPQPIRDSYGFYFSFDTLLIEVSCPLN